MTSIKIESQQSTVESPEQAVLDSTKKRNGASSRNIHDDYWHRKLTGASHVLTLPFDQPRSFSHYSNIESSFGGGVLTNLHRLASTEGIPFPALLLAAWQCLLSRWSGQTDLLVCVQPLDILEEKNGAVISLDSFLAPIRVDLSGDINFLVFLRQVVINVFEAAAHLAVPAEWLVASTDPERSSCVQVRFAIGTSINSESQAPEPPVDLALTVNVHLNGLNFRIDYNECIFKCETVEALLEQYLTLLDSISENPECPVSSLPLTSARERLALERLWHVEDEVEQEMVCLHELITEKANGDLDRIALVYEAQQLSYRDLELRAERLAGYLVYLGAKPNELIGICVERSVDLIVGILAILKAGSAYLPLEPIAPVDRLAFILEDSAAPILITQRHLVNRLPTNIAKVVCLDDLTEHIPFTSLPKTKPDSLAYCIYTSGSTGQPKGVLVSHENVMQLLTATTQQFNFNKADVWTLFHSCAFDFSVWELFGCLGHGGKLVIVPQLVAQSPDLLFELLERESVTVLNSTPSAFRALATVAACQPQLSELRVVIFGGEALYPSMLLTWTAMYGWNKPELVNMYGITETTVHVTYRPLRIEDAISTGLSPIGKPLDHLGVKLLDSNYNPVPRGIPGEIYVCGAGVSRGYINRLELTESRFIPDFFTGRGRLYRTGDLARQSMSGELEYLGRIDSQIKLHGYRIELGEIEASLTAMDCISEAVASLVGDTPDETRIVAWITGKPGSLLDPTLIRAEMARTLPRYMIPARIVVIQKLPLNSNYKIDRVKLLTMLDNSRPDTTPFFPPQSQCETTLAAIWERVLEISPISLTDNFFALGGDSIRALQAVQHARKHGIKITLSDILGTDTLSELSALAQQELADTQDQSLAVVCSHMKAKNLYPLSAMQRLMVEAYQGNRLNGKGVYHAQQVLRFHNRNASASLLREALVRVTQAHPMLRTAFHLDASGGPKQEVLASIQEDFSEIDISGLSSDAQYAELCRIMLEDRCSPFMQDTPGASLLRLRMLRRQEDEFDLLISSHHAIEDGWGSQQFLNDLLSVYTRLQTGLAHGLEPRTNVFREFVELEAYKAIAPEVAVFWRDYYSRLLHTPAPLLPPEQPYLVEGDVESSIVRFPEVMLIIREAALRHRVSIKSILLTVYQAALSDILNWPIPSIGVVASGRTPDLSEPLTSLGMFWSFVPFATQSLPVNGRGFKSTMRQLSILDENATALGALLYKPISRGELFNITFNFVELHNTPMRNKSSLLTGEFLLGFDKFHYPINTLFAIDPIDRELSLHIEYDYEVVNVGTIQALEKRIAYYLYALS